jgi:hypothetical protein
MPYSTDKLALNDPFLKKSVKLLPCQKEMIKYWYDKGISINQISRDFKVSKRLVQFILFPERLIKNKKDRIDRGGTKIYYHKEKHAQAMKKHRRYKYDVL